MLEIDNLTTGYNDIPVLKNVTLSIKEGEFVALLGSNNAGKTTLLNCISGFLPVWKGSKTFLSMNFTDKKPEEIVHMGLIQIPEGRKIFPKMNVYENLLTGGISRRAKERRNNNIAYVFSLFPILKERSKQTAGTMSGGEQQMLAIARALMAEPKLLVLDEPSLGLAPIVVEEIFGALNQLNKEGLTILLVEQNLNISLIYATRGYVLERGEMVLKGSSKELKENEQTRKAYLGL